MMENESKDLTLNMSISELQDRLLQENDSVEMEKIIDLFNLNLKKKDIIRASKLTELQDLIYSQMYQRIDKRAGEFSNKDLIEYFKAIQAALEKADIESVKIPPIQIQQNNQINVSENVLSSKESRDRMKEILQDILKNVNQPKNIIEPQELENDTESNYTETAE